MPGTSTVTDITVANPAYDISFRLVDSSGDQRTVTFRTPPQGSPPPTADVKAVGDALQAASNASLYEINITTRWIGPKDAGQADKATVESVFDNIVINYKDAAQRTQQSAYIPSPLGTLILSGDVVGTSQIEYTNYRDAVDTLLGGGYEPITARFTERREKNDSTPA